MPIYLVTVVKVRHESQNPHQQAKFLREQANRRVYSRRIIIARSKLRHESPQPHHKAKNQPLTKSIRGGQNGIRGGQNAGRSNPIGISALSSRRARTQAPTRE
jgi:hypothetical protein